MKIKEVALIGFSIGFSIMCLLWSILWTVMAADLKERVIELEQICINEVENEN